MRRASLAAGLVALSVAVAPYASAQTPDAPSPAGTPAPPAVTPPAPTPPAVLAPAGSPVILELVNSVSSKAVKQGDMFPLRLAAPIVVDGRVVVPLGATGEGQVVDAAASGALGRPAKLVLAARYIKVDGVRVDLRGFRLGAAGKDNSNAIMAASFVPYVGMLALFAHGGEIDIPAGALGQAKLAADLPLPEAAAQVSNTPGPPASAPSP